MKLSEAIEVLKEIKDEPFMFASKNDEISEAIKTIINHHKPKAEKEKSTKSQ